MPYDTSSGSPKQNAKFTPTFSGGTIEVSQANWEEAY